MSNLSYITIISVGRSMSLIVIWFKEATKFISNLNLFSEKTWFEISRVILA